MCKIEGCERKTKARNLCSMHYKRWLRTGKPEEKGIPNYKGDNAKYLAIHVRLNRHLGKAATHLCIGCLNRADEWSYLHLTSEFKVDIVSGVTVRYSTKLEDYGPLCYSCHRKFDGPLAQ